MRIDRKRASEYRSIEIEEMLKTGTTWFTNKRLTKSEAYELRKVLTMRKESK